MVFNNINVRKYHVDFDGVTYPRDRVGIDYASIEYVDQRKDLKLFYKEYVGEEIPDTFMSFTDLKNKYPLQVIDIRFQVDHFNPKKTEKFEEFGGVIYNVRLFMISIRHRKLKKISDGTKTTEVTVI